MTEDRFIFSDTPQPVSVTCDLSMLKSILALLPKDLQPDLIRLHKAERVWSLHFYGMDLPPGWYTITVNSKPATGFWSFEFTEASPRASAASQTEPGPSGD